MTSAETAAIDKLRDELHSYHGAVIQLTERCEPCRKIVIGNGNSPINVRIDRLEQDKKRSTRFWAIVVGVSAGISSIITTIVGWWK